MARKYKKPKKKAPLLRQLREKAKLTGATVARATQRIAEITGDKDYYISRARLWQLEMLEQQTLTGAKLAVLAMLYGVKPEELLPHFYPTLYVPAVVEVVKEVANAS